MFGVNFIIDIAFLNLNSKRGVDFLPGQNIELIGVCTPEHLKTDDWNSKCWNLKTDDLEFEN